MSPLKILQIMASNGMTEVGNSFSSNKPQANRVRRLHAYPAEPPSSSNHGPFFGHSYPLSPKLVWHGSLLAEILAETRILRSGCGRRMTCAAVASDHLRSRSAMLSESSKVRSREADINVGDQEHLQMTVIDSGCVHFC